MIVMENGNICILKLITKFRGSDFYHTLYKQIKKLYYSENTSVYNDFHKLKAVSYTHLDVYKRQG